MTQTIETASANDHTYSFEQLAATDPEHFVPLHQTPLNIGHVALSHEIVTPPDTGPVKVSDFIGQDIPLESSVEQENFSLLFPVGFLLEDNRTGPGIPAEGDDTVATRLLLAETADGAETLIAQMRERPIAATGDEIVDTAMITIRNQEADHAAMQLANYYLEKQDSESARRIAETIEDPIKGLQVMSDIERYITDHSPEHQRGTELVDEIKERIADITGEPEISDLTAANIDKFDRLVLAALHAAAEVIDDQELADAAHKAYREKEIPSFARRAA